MSNQLDMDAIRIAAERDRLIDRIDERDATIKRLRAALKAIELARLTDTKEDWTRATKLSDAVLGEKA